MLDKIENLKYNNENFQDFCIFFIISFEQLLNCIMATRGTGLIIHQHTRVDGKKLQHLKRQC